MSLIHTCNLAKVDPIDYLTQLQLHASQVIAARVNGCRGTIGST